MNNCDQAIEQLLDYLSAKPQAPQAPAEALRHMVACGRCQSRLARLGAALQVAEEDRLSCADCEALLPPYLLAEAAGAAEAPEWLNVRLHLSLCPHCAGDYQALRELDQLEAQAAPAAPVLLRRPQLDFLAHRQVPAGRIWWFDQLGRLIIERTSDLLSGLSLPAAPALAVKAGPHAQTLGRLEVGALAGGLAAALEVTQRGADADSLELSIAVQLPGRSWPDLGGVEVRLTRPDGEELMRLSDAFGRASFAPLSRAELAQLVVRITPPGGS